MFNSTGEISIGEPEKEFSLPASIADHTGSISQCRLNGTVVEDMLGWNVSTLYIDPDKLIFQLKGFDVFLILIFFLYLHKSLC